MVNTVSLLVAPLFAQSVIKGKPTVEENLMSIIRYSKSDKCPKDNNNKEKVLIFDDGSIESKLLESDCKQNPFIRVVKVKVDKSANRNDIEKDYMQHLPKYASSGRTTKVYLHFCREDFLEYNIDQQRNKLRNYYPHLSIFWAYEFMTKEVVQYRYKQLEAISSNIPTNV